ncbi:MAG TPA: hypothetical protein ENI11_00245 [Actinobacteria bacterium]|nr:hypothetical protein [Actinomycetota bacterium]
MRSMRSVDDRSKYGIPFAVESEAEEPKSAGFLGIAIVLFAVYAMTSRPVLYTSISEWISQLMDLKFFVHIGG